jgi:hypothetical protein
MYVYYEYHKDASGKIVLTELVLSSSGTGRLSISFFNKIENMIFEICKLALKHAPVAQRSYDPATSVWSYFDEWGQFTLDRLVSVTDAITQKVTLIEVQDLVAQAVNKQIDLSAKRVRPEDFFYNYGKPVAQAAMTKETVAQRLKQLMGETLDKSSYRRAALRYHPDRNNGDGTKMAELNSLWSVYNG